MQEETLNFPPAENLNGQGAIELHANNAGGIFPHYTAMQLAKSSNKPTEFQRELLGAIRQTIAQLDRGTIGIHRECLWQLTVSKISRCPHAPQGACAALTARQEFNAIVSTKPFQTFVYL